MNTAASLSRLRRSLLYVPGDREAMIAKAAQRGADGLILNLEDAVAPGNKDLARNVVAQALATLDFGRAEVIVRINPLDTLTGYRDLLAIAPAKPDAILLPKVGSPEEVRFAAWTLARLEEMHDLPAGGIRLMCMIESAAGVLAAAQIAGCHPRVAALLFGAADYSAEVGCAITPDGETLFLAQSQIVLASRAAGIDAIDTPHMRLDDRRRPGAQQPTRTPARLRRQVGDPPRPDRRDQRRFLAHARADRLGRAGAGRTAGRRRGVHGRPAVGRRGARWAAHRGAASGARTAYAGAASPDRSPMTDLHAQISGTLAGLSCDYAFYFRRRSDCRRSHEPIFLRTCDLFPSASIIKIPILYAWAHLERAGEVDRAEMCDLDAEAQVEGAGLSWLLRTRRLPYADVLLLMIALSDNLCTNLVIRRIGIERLGNVFRQQLGLTGTRLERKLMDYEARARGLDNWISAQDCIQLFRVRDSLTAAERAWLDPMLLACVDGGLWLRNVPRDTVSFYHKTGSIEGVLHDWGFTEQADLFLLTRNVRDESEVCRALDVLGPILLT